MSKRDAPATHRNREPILEVLARWLLEPARVLEVASGTGQHAAFFAERLPHLQWQPSDHDRAAIDSIEGWVADTASGNLALPILLDACAEDWPVGEVDAVFNANMIHIAPRKVALGLMRGAGRCLATGGLLMLYGPFKIDGAHTAPSNEAFDRDLRRRDPEWGVRDLEWIAEAAAENGLTLVERNEMPANNQLLVFRRG